MRDLVSEPYKWEIICEEVKENEEGKTKEGKIEDRGSH